MFRKQRRVKPDWKPKVGELEVKAQLVDITDLVGPRDKGVKVEEETRPEVENERIRQLVATVAMDLVMGRTPRPATFVELDELLEEREDKPLDISFDLSFFDDPPVVEAKPESLDGQDQ